jgi:putative exporter of polyketide antibiotics
MGTALLISGVGWASGIFVYAQTGSWIKALVALILATAFMVALCLTVEETKR